MGKLLSVGKTLAAALGVGGLLLAALAALFAAGEIRAGVRAACSAPGAGRAARFACRALGVEHLPPVAPLELPDSADALDAERVAVPDCATGQGLEQLVPRDRDLERIERELGRDLDDSGAVGTARPRAARIAEARAGPTRGELLLARKDVPPLPRGGRLTATVAAVGGPARLDLVPRAVPRFEWLHELELAGEVGLPIGGRAVGDELRLEGEWRFARWRAARFGLAATIERPRAEVRDALGDELLTSATLRLSVLCLGLGDCEPR